MTEEEYARLDVIRRIVDSRQFRPAMEALRASLAATALDGDDARAAEARGLARLLTAFEGLLNGAANEVRAIDHIGTKNG